MPRRWLQSVDVEIDPAIGALLVDARSPITFKGGTKSVAAVNTPEPLVRQSTPCRFVWVATPVADDGEAINTKAVYIGDGENQNLPLMPRNYRGVVIRIDDAAKLFVRVAVAGESVVYRIST